MKRISIALAGAMLAGLAVVATALAVNPSPGPPSDQVTARDTIPQVLGLSWEEIRALRQDGLSLGDIAERQEVDPDKLIDALVARWTVRIEARLANGSLTATEAAELKTQLLARATGMVNQVTLGGMHGAAVGAGPAGGNGMGAGRGPGAGGAGFGPGPNAADQPSGICDGSGPHGRGR